MSNTYQLRFLVLLMAFGLVAAGCSSDDSDGGTKTTMNAEMDVDSGFAFGDPMDAGTADRVVEISAGDNLRFVPEGVIITAGETITFRVTNEGAIPHDFVLGGAEMQDEFEAERATAVDDIMVDEPNAFVLDPGETKEMTWHMTRSGEILFGCHQPGHYAAGMKGTVRVSG